MMNLWSGLMDLLSWNRDTEPSPESLRQADDVHQSISRANGAADRADALSKFVLDRDLLNAEVDVLHGEWRRRKDD